MVKHISDRIGVMYLGSMVEISPKDKLYDRPLHPYTRALISAIPIPNPAVSSKDRVKLEGEIPSPIHAPEGCKFSTRCRYCGDKCKTCRPVLKEVDKDHFVACHLYDEGSEAAIRSMESIDRQLK